MRTGVWGDGFIGRSLAITLADSGVDVCILNRKGEAKASSARGDIPARSMAFEACEQDMCAAMSDLSLLIHCAGNAQQDYDAYYAATLCMSRAAVAAKVPRVIIFSTVAVYGTALPQGGMGSAFAVNKTLQPVPATPYAISRFKTETDARKTLESGGVALTVVRIPMAIGPGMNAVVFKRLASLLRKGVFPRLSVRHATLPCVGIRRLSLCLSRIAMEPAFDQPLYQIADSVSWADITDRFRLRLGLRFRTLPVPGRALYVVLNLLGRERLAATIRSLMNTAVYEDDSRVILGAERADKWSTSQCIEETIAAMGLEGMQRGKCSCAKTH